MQMPYAVVVVSVLGVLTPQLAGMSTAEDFAGLSERLRFGLRQSLVIIIPCTLVLLVLAQPIVAILLNHLNARHDILAGTVLAVLAAGLPGFTVFQLCVRGLQSMQRAREVFYLYALQNVLTIILCVAIGRHSMAGLTASVSIAYSAAAIVALAALARHHVQYRVGDLVATRASQPRRLVGRGARHGARVLRADVEPRRRPRDAFPVRRPRRTRRLRAGRRTPAPPRDARRGERCKAELVQRGAMARIRVVTDSACDIPEEIARRLNIDIVSLDHPLRRRGVHRSRRPLPRGVLGEVQSEQDAARDRGAVPRRLPGGVRTSEGPTTATASSCSRCRHCSRRRISPRCSDPKHWATALPVRVVDTKAVSMAQGLLVIDVAELAATGRRTRPTRRARRVIGAQGRRRGDARHPRAPHQGWPRRRRARTARPGPLHQAVAGTQGRRRRRSRSSTHSLQGAWSPSPRRRNPTRR